MADNKIVGEALRHSHSKWAMRTSRKVRAIRLPSEAHIQFFRSGSGARIYMSGSEASSNMQTNAAGFEGWALALRLWLELGEVTLQWAPPNRGLGEPLNRHYARFLYRVQRFQELFPDWFRIGTPEHLGDCAVLGGEELFLNVPGAISLEPAEPKRETKIERALVRDHSDLLKQALGLRLVDRQFPVGLYRTQDLKNPVFTGGTSAIDIVGVGHDDFTLIELKAGSNIMVGALSELLFYAAVARDAACSRFKFGGAATGVSRSKIGPEHVRTAKRIRAILMAEQFHPLLEHVGLVRTLNEAAREQQKLVPLSFEQWLLTDFDGLTGPQFERVAA